MPNDTSPPRNAQAVLVRERAQALLQNLTTEAARLEHTLARAGRGDQMKQITGRNALDDAIHSTRRLIDCMDSYLGGDDVRATRVIPYHTPPTLHPARIRS